MAAKLTRRGLNRVVCQASACRVILTSSIVNPYVQNKFRAGGWLKNSKAVC
jgi:hypothetical protein